jgi:PAS domain S-box-containing protein
MAKKNQGNFNFFLTVIVGTLLVILVVALGVSFFNAIFYTQLDSKKDFLSKQTELAALGLEIEFDRFEEDSKNFGIHLNDSDLDEEDFQEEFNIYTRRFFNTYPFLIDTIWVDLKDSVLMFTLTDRNDFVRALYQGDFPNLKERPSSLQVENKLGFKVFYSLNLPNFSREHVANFYLNPGSRKFLFLDSESIDLSKTPDNLDFEILPEYLQLINQDISLGLKGIYPIFWEQGGENVSGILAQYPFRLGRLNTKASLIFLIPTESLTSGIYTTYIYLFVGLVLLLIGTVVFFTISLRNNIEAVRIQSENLLEISQLFDQQNLLLKELKGFVFFHDDKGEITRVSEEVEIVLGHPKQDFIEAFNKNFEHPLALEVKRKIGELLIQKNDFIDLEYDFVRPDGEKIRVRIFEKLIYDSEGNFKGGLGICTDVTDQYLARIEIFQSENKLRNLINNLPDIIFIYDNEGKVLDFHVQDRENLREPAKYTLGKKLHEFVPHGQADEIFSTFIEARKTGKIQTVDAVWHSDDGDKFYEMRFFPFDENQMVSISKDVTGQKIWERGLVEAMKAADKASRAKSEFLANMSHEIRTPMNGLLGIIDLLESTNLGKIQKQYVEIIKNSGNALLSIIKDILDYSKIESGKIEIFPSVFNPDEELKKLAEILSGIARKKRIDLKIQIESNVSTPVEADADKINQVLLNLIGNAIKFTPEDGKVEVKMTLEPMDEVFYFLHCSVKDDGIGIPKEHLEKLADPFFQVESSNSRSYQGTGLGLAIAKKLIELMGGQLIIVSEPGKGAEFSFSILVKKVDSDSIPREHKKLSWRDVKEMGAVFPLKILLAEDNDLNLQLMSLMFQQLGFDFEIAQNGIEAVQKVKESEFDLVLMDVQMPQLNGLEASKLIRKIPGKEHLIIIGLSANVFEEDKKKAFESGMNDYLTKPIRLAELADKLEYYYRQIKKKELS